MQLLSMYSALFFGTILATTTDAAPRGLKKNDDSASRRMLMGSKGGGGNIAVGVLPPVGVLISVDTVEAPIPASCVDENPLDKSTDAESTCRMLEVFDHMGRDENNIRDADGLQWSPLCDDFDPLDKFLCPTEDAVAAICSAPVPDLNPAVMNEWCIPMFGMIDDIERREDCIKFCTNYVSAARGDCCNIDCFTGISNDEDFP